MKKERAPHKKKEFAPEAKIADVEQKQALGVKAVQVQADLARRGNVQQAFKQLEKTQVRTYMSCCSLALLFEVIIASFSLCYLSIYHRLFDVFFPLITSLIQVLCLMLGNTGMGRVAVLANAAKETHRAELRAVGVTALRYVRLLGTFWATHAIIIQYLYSSCED